MAPILSLFMYVDACIECTHCHYVQATDADSHRNGEVIYSLYYPKGESRKPFVINSATGALTASPYVEFDRETRPFEDVTIKVRLTVL